MYICFVIHVYEQVKKCKGYTPLYLEGMFGSAEILIRFYMYLVLFLKRGREIFAMAECLAELSPAVM